jgi:DsbC/DsbD-like thiol-disulfide interchange protein
MKSARQIICSLLLFVSAAALAQSSGPLVTVAPVDPVVVAPGGKTDLALQLRVSRGFHINSNKPTDDLLIPTTVHLSPPQGVMIVNIAYPDGQLLALPFLSEKLNVYNGDFQVTAQVRVPSSTPLGTQRVHGEVKYQACDNRQCYPPKSTPFEFDVKVERAKVKKSAYNPQSPHIHQ